MTTLQTPTPATATPRERFIAALERRPILGLVPHFELVFFLTMEAFGKVHPSHRSYHQWQQMEERERRLHRLDMAQLYIDIAKRYGHSAIFVHPNPDGVEETCLLIDTIRELSGNQYFIMRHGDATFSIPNGEQMMDFAYRLADEPEKVHAEAARHVDHALATAEAYRKHGGLDGFALCADYCFNTGPFMSPTLFSEFVTPYLARLTRGYRDMGFYVIKHTDGNINPILDQLLQANPHAIHSLDPQGGVDIAEIKRICGDRVCLIGNVNCAMLDTGTIEDAKGSALYALQSGMPGGGYIFSTSNCVYTGMPLDHYDAILEVWREHGVYR
ncbi:MAG TPA: uroporphyrinogen decarboxylase family protein [Capsulimonadaceae bacterium]|jgi:uroporphyrinogen decarboxylase